MRLRRPFLGIRTNTCIYIERERRSKVEGRDAGNTKVTGATEEIADTSLVYSPRVPSQKCTYSNRTAQMDGNGVWGSRRNQAPDKRIDVEVRA
jgi:hypothetical protein